MNAYTYNIYLYTISFCGDGGTVMPCLGNSRYWGRTVALIHATKAAVFNCFQLNLFAYADLVLAIVIDFSAWA